MANNLENIELIDRTAADYIQSYRDPNKTYTGHDIPHLRSVAGLTELAGLTAGFSLRDIELSRVAGWFHDFERSMNETNEKSDERLSADAMLQFAAELDQGNLLHVSSDEFEAMEYAILKNGRPPAFFADRPAPIQWTLPERLLAGLFVADKLEQNGVWVIARRSQFVGGARLRDEDADLPKYGLKPFVDAVNAVLLESAARIAFINPEGIYPLVFQPLTSRMYLPQRDFIYGLLRAEGMTMEGYAEMILDTKLIEDPNHPNYLQARKLSVPENPVDLAHILRETGGLSDLGISTTSEDLAASSVEAVDHFSSNYQIPLEQLVRQWTPRHDTARLWRQSMLAYASGEWFDNTRQQLLSNAPLQGFQA